MGADEGNLLLIVMGVELLMLTFSVLFANSR